MPMEASVTVEVNAGEKGDVKYALVGLADAAVKESLDRILFAIVCARFFISISFKVQIVPKL